MAETYGGGGGGEVIAKGVRRMTGRIMMWSMGWSVDVLYDVIPRPAWKTSALMCLFDVLCGVGVGGW